MVLLDQQAMAVPVATRLSLALGLWGLGFMVATVATVEPIAALVAAVERQVIRALAAQVARAAPPLAEVDLRGQAAAVAAAGLHMMELVERSLVAVVGASACLELVHPGLVALGQPPAAAGPPAMPMAAAAGREVTLGSLSCPRRPILAITSAAVFAAVVAAEPCVVEHRVRGRVVRAASASSSVPTNTQVVLPKTQTKLSSRLQVRVRGRFRPG